MNYNDMMRTVAGTTGLTRRQADELMVSTLTVLSETISAPETKDLLAELPKSFRERVPVSEELAVCSGVVLEALELGTVLEAHHWVPIVRQCCPRTLG